jgi:hypothetical protein
VIAIPQFSTPWIRIVFHGRFAFGLLDASLLETLLSMGGVG